MSVPRNVSAILAKIQGAKVTPVKKVAAPKVEEPEPHVGSPDSGREAAKLRQRAKKAEADLATVTAERDTLKAEADSLRPAAKKWNDYEHVEKSKLIEKLPVELRKDCKDMPLHHLRMFAKGNEATAPKEGDKKPTETNDLLELQKTGDKKAIGEYIAKVKSGELIPAQPKAEVAA